jgi:hypothetical protein
MQPILNTSAPAVMPPMRDRQFIRQWTTKDKVICLFREPDRFAFSTEGRMGPTRSFKSTVYDIDYATSLIPMFHRVIGTNLATQEPHSSCFLPQLCLAAQNEPTQLVALFGRVDTRTDEIVGLRWGVFDTSTQEQSSLEISADDAISRNFLRKAPGTNYRKMERLVDKKGRSVEREANDSYARSFFEKHFYVVIHRDETHIIQNITLYCTSLLDRNVVLDENNWAVTLVSAKKRRGVGAWLNAGHAMIACEGIKADGFFLKYLHISAESTMSKVAQIEVSQKTSLIDSVNGPTWSRTKDFVEKMLSHRGYVENPPDRRADDIGFNILAPLINIFRNLGALEVDRWNKTAQENCLSFCVSILRRAGIELQEPEYPNPNGYIKRLQSDFTFEERPNGIIEAVSRNRAERENYANDSTIRNVVEFAVLSKKIFEDMDKEKQSREVGLK